jgi:outer membrane lipoprotein-sorting protein
MERNIAVKVGFLFLIIGVLLVLSGCFFKDPIIGKWHYMSSNGEAWLQFDEDNSVHQYMTGYSGDGTWKKITDNYYEITSGAGKKLVWIYDPASQSIYEVESPDNRYTKV